MTEESTNRGRRKLRPRGLSLEETFRWHMPGEPPSEECWLWTKGTADGRYGGFMYDGKSRRAHVASYEIFKGPVPPGLYVLHDPAVCNTPLCVNPNHLRVGTSAENMADKQISGTAARGARQHLAKLDDERVMEIRRRWANGEHQKALARDYGVGQSTVSAIVRGETWTHLPIVAREVRGA